MSTNSTTSAGSTTGTSNTVASSSSSFTLTSPTTSSSPTSTAPSSTSTQTSSTSGATSQTSTQTLTATCTSTTSSNATATVLALIPQLNAYPSMTLSFSGKTGAMSTSENFTFSYSVVSETSTTYMVEGEFTGTPSLTFTAWLLKNGTTLAINSGHGHPNITGSLAGTLVQGYFGEFAAVQGFVQEQSLYSNLFRLNGTSNVTIGSYTFTVTNYVANALPETIQLCNGETDQLTTYHLSEGTPSGSSYELPTYVRIAGSSTIAGSTTPFDFEIQVTAFTIA